LATRDTKLIESPPTSGTGECTYAEADDRALVEQTLNGNKSAFGVLVGRYQKPLFNTALRMTGDGEEAKDITQTAFVKAYERLGTFKPKYRFFSWLYRILINETLNCLRVRDRYQEIAESTPSPDPDPEEVYERSQVRHQIQKALLDLSADYRTVILLRYYEDMTYQEMSYVLCIPEKTVKSRLYTARRILADHLQ